MPGISDEAPIGSVPGGGSGSLYCRTGSLTDVPVSADAILSAISYIDSRSKLTLDSVSVISTFCAAWRDSHHCRKGDAGSPHAESRRAAPR